MDNDNCNSYDNYNSYDRNGMNNDGINCCRNSDASNLPFA